MAALEIPQKLIEQLEEIADKQQRSIEAVLEQFIQNYQLEKYEDETALDDNPMLGLTGIITPEETQSTDISSAIRETLRDNVHPQWGFTTKTILIDTYLH